MNIDQDGSSDGKTVHLEWNVARLPKAGELYCGDCHLITQAGNKILIAAIDGVGHGKKAEEAAEMARSSLERFRGESLISLIRRCHEDLKRTRGAVMSLAVFDGNDNTLSWLSVGNVEGVLVRAGGEQKNRNIILRGGIVGYHLPSLQASIFPISPGDTLILTTDGVMDSYTDNISIHNSTSQLVDYISANYFKQDDDALIVAVRFKNNH
jgi:serine phosphatase RsbU (regulator of sigma subunit)